MTLVAPEVRFNALAIFVTPDFPLAIVFIVRTSSFVHARRTTFFAFAIPAPNLAGHAVLRDGLRWQAMDKHCCDNVIRDQGGSPPLFEISNHGLFREYDVREVSVERASAFPGCSQGPLSRPRRRQDCRPCSAGTGPPRCPHDFAIRIVLFAHTTLPVRLAFGNKRHGR
jgi:hypothetical protein